MFIFRSGYQIAKENIDYILNAPPANALEKIMKRQMQEVQKALKDGDEERLEKLLDEAVPLETDKD